MGLTLDSSDSNLTKLVSEKRKYFQLIVKASRSTAKQLLTLNTPVIELVRFSQTYEYHQGYKVTKLSQMTYSKFQNQASHFEGLEIDTCLLDSP